MSTKQESGDDQDMLDLESAIGDETINPDVFSIRNALEQPDARAYTTLELHIQLHNAKIDLNPPYQRDVVWPIVKQMEIIDSLFHNIYIPPVIFALMRDEDGEEVRVCVDGKQRLTSIQKFFDGQIGYRDPDTRKLWWYQVPAAHRRKHDEISQEGKRNFENKTIICVEYKMLLPASERELFQRVQLGMSLTVAEKLQAIASPWADYVNHLDGEYIQRLAIHVEFNVKRGRTFQNLASILYCCEDADVRRIPSATQLERWLNGPQGPSRTFKSRVERMLSNLAQVASDPALNGGFAAFSSKVSPAEFVYIGVLFYIMDGDGMDFRDRERAAAVLYLRHELRQAHKDVRLNARISNHSRDIINTVHERKVNLSLSSMMQMVAPKGAVSGKDSKSKMRAQSDDDSGNEKASSLPPRQRRQRHALKRELSFTAGAISFRPTI